MDDQLPLNHQTYIRLTALALWDNLPLVLLAGLLFSLLCLPAFVFFYLGPLLVAFIIAALTVAPAWAALLALQGAILRGEKSSLRLMLSALPRNWRPGAVLGLMIVFPIMAALVTLPLLARPIVPLIVWLGLAADALGLLLLLILSLYAFPLLVLYHLSWRDALRNGLILASRNLVNTVGLLAMGVLMALATLYFSSGLLFIWPALWGMFIVNNCRLLVSDEEERKTNS